MIKTKKNDKNILSTKLMPRSKFNFSSKPKSNKVAPAPTSNSPSLGQSLAGNVVAGMGVGIGSGIGHAMVGSMMSSKSESQVVPNNTQVQPKEPSIACSIILNEYKQCLKRQENGEYVDCKDFMKKAMENGC